MKVPAGLVTMTYQVDFPSYQADDARNFLPSLPLDELIATEMFGGRGTRADRDYKTDT